MTHQAQQPGLTLSSWPRRPGTAGRVTDSVSDQRALAYHNLGSLADARTGNSPSPESLQWFDKALALMPGLIIGRKVRDMQH